MSNNRKIISKPALDEVRIRQKLLPVREYEVFSSPQIAEFAKGRKFFIRTYGCQANIRDEEVVSGILKNAGFTKTNRPSTADVILLNTCAVRENAEDKVLGELGSLKTLKATNRDLIIAVSGCMSQQEQVIDLLLEKYPQVDIILGTHNIYKIVELIDIHLRENCRVVDVKARPLEIVEKLPSARNSTYKAFVNISYGCDKFCTYCIVPYTRGQERSRPQKEILDECRELVKNGYQEITLLGQNVNSYGKDINGKATFSALLEEVAQLGIPHLRFLTSHPYDFGEDIVEVMKRHGNIMKYIHLPVQSGSDAVLRAMGRRYSREQYLATLKMIREKLPGVAISTDIIVGFPNETDAQFMDTISLVKEAKYESAFTFIYSPRQGTPAARLIDNVTKGEKSARFKLLTKTLEETIAHASAEMVGKTYAVLVDGWSKKDKEVLSGYTESNKLLHFKGDASLIGKIVQVRVLESHVFSLLGELVND
ncbi:MAG: tRNA (N6-isopentenyl adenosine(37)-C2)-methylthiotransferase MiaB [Bacteroidia bacterium]|nr:tRNA (N6-isopentenyl adenosine(37)-C2)-methylthiotransferase MiaB [Bacteroidia bacterium]